MSNNPHIRRIHLIRHGETNWNKEKRAQGQLDSVLTENGVLQAQQLKSRLEALAIAEVHCSSSTRARQTAEIVFGSRDIPVQYCDQLREIHMGPWQGQLYADLRAAEPEQYHAFWHEPEKFLLDGAETYADVQKRAVRKLDGILAHSRATDIAIVSHGILIKTLLCDVLQTPLAMLWQAPVMHNCATSVIEIQEDGSRRISLYADQVC